MPDNKQISINKKWKELSTPDPEFPLEAKAPNNILIEITNACNLRCKMCYNPQMKRKKGFISEKLYKRVINQAAELGVDNAGLYTTGESFLHPKIFEFIKYAKDKGIKYVYITTNGQAFNNDNIEKIFTSGLDSIKFSVDAGDKKSYESFKSASWDKLIDIMKKIKKMRDEKNSHLRIFASFVVMPDNFNDLTGYNNVFRNLVDEIKYTPIANQGSQVNIEHTQLKAVSSLFSDLIAPKEEWSPCSFLWNRFIVTHEGYLTICCVDFENQLIYGDLNKQSLIDCWNNKKIKEFREIHKMKEFTKLPMCYNCSFIKRNKKAHSLFLKEMDKILKKEKESKK